MSITVLDPVVSLPGSDSPLRRRSGIPVLPLITALPENNDEVERSERRQELNIVTLASKDSPANSRRSLLGLGFLAHMPMPQMKERMTQCIQLNAENKINVKNAFSLEVIDFMTYMIKKKEGNISNLQVASTALDVSTKVYGFRVDGIYNELLRLSIGTDNIQEKDENGELGGHERENPEDANDKQGRKRKKKSRHKVLATPNELKGNIDMCKPSLLMSRDEARTSDLLSQAILPNHARTGYYLHPYNDVIIDTVDHTEIQNKNKGAAIPIIKSFSHLDICPVLSTFEFHNCQEEDDEKNSEAENEHEEFEFNPDVSIPSSNEAPMYNMNYLDTNTEDESPEPQKQSREVQNVVDLRHLMIVSSPSKRSEYSFIQKGLNIHWAGPSHWKVRNLRKPILGSSNVVETCQQMPVKKRENSEIKYSAEKKEEAKTKFVQGQAVQLQPKTARQDWFEERILLPTDMGYDIADAQKLYLHRLLTVRTQSDDLNTTHLSDDAIKYDYNNENDVSNYCPNLAGGYDTGDEPNDDQNAFGDSDQDIPLTFTGQNLVAAPKLANKLSIAYNTQAKRIDMRQLKKSIWKTLISPNDKENIDTQEIVDASPCDEMKETKRFSEVSKTLPLMLSKTNAEALTFPISFVSLLHLANEKSLCINILPDRSDFTICGR